jgi:hypothetical protein
MSLGLPDRPTHAIMDADSYTTFTAGIASNLGLPIYNFKQPEVTRCERLT